MNVYVDTSVVLRVLFRERGRIVEWGKWKKAFVNRIWLTEAMRVIERLRLQGAIDDADRASLQSDIRIIHDSFHVVPLTEGLLEQAEGSFPTVIGTLDAIHLASADLVRRREKIDVFLTHDKRLGTAARSLGFAVKGTKPQPSR
ncbi:MAG: type II toxin-antitoxin system VapC family toxin [Verrucomicrobia bacterium]|nr:type II toxin-antitoxin system VapC family toxin [Verrucomicrobiota bacterium]